jgi:hypothetical protein
LEADDIRHLLTAVPKLIGKHEERQKYIAFFFCRKLGLSNFVDKGSEFSVVGSRNELKITELFYSTLLKKY